MVSNNSKFTSTGYKDSELDYIKRKTKEYEAATPIGRPKQQYEKYFGSLTNDRHK